MKNLQFKKKNCHLLKKNEKKSYEKQQILGKNFQQVVITRFSFNSALGRDMIKSIKL